MRRYLARIVATLTLSFTFTLSMAAQTKQEQPSTANPAAKVSATSQKNGDVKAQSAPAPLTPEQAQLQAQVDKLYQLAQDLKAAVAKSNKDTLSIDVIKKADAVEDAAKHLKDQMKNSPQTASHN